MESAHYRGQLQDLILGAVFIDFLVDKKVEEVDVPLLLLVRGQDHQQELQLLRAVVCQPLQSLGFPCVQKKIVALFVKYNKCKFNKKN
jgi:hypothetical protein